jgi:hypothetical protein
VRLIRIIFSFFYKDAEEQYLYFVPSYDVLRWVTYGIQVVVVIMQRIYPM